MAIRRSLVVALIPAVILLAAGCAAHKGTGTQPSAAPSRTPTVDPSVADAQEAALSAYNGYIETFALASQSANPDDPNLSRYVADPLLSLTRHNIRVLKDMGAVQLGAQKATVTGSEVNLTGTPPTVTIHACLDYSALKLVYAANQSPVPNSVLKVTRIPAQAKVAQYPGERWLVNESKQQGSEPC
jgi:alkanesulfonate monooxygenase SsuD/methylene tetrahydromethanopterin reductase-like flavin-dependent oxidoreductase (luciferase family)